MSARLAVITGGSGFIGSHLTALLVRRGIPVRILDIRPPQGKLPEGVDYLQGSILDPDMLTTALNGAKILYHMAANTHLWARDKSVFAKINTEGTERVLAEAARQKTGKIIITSTEVILRGWNNPDLSPLNENAPLPGLKDMAGDYDRSKLKAELIARKAAREGLPVIITYPTVPIGAGDWQMTAPTRMIRDFINGKTPAYLDCMLNLIAVEDVAMGHYMAAEKGRPGDRFILAGEDIRLKKLLAMLEDLSGTAMPERRVPYWLAAMAGHVSECTADHITRNPPTAPLTGIRFAKHSWPVDGSKATEELGLHRTPIRNALKACIDWLRKNQIQG